MGAFADELQLRALLEVLVLGCACGPLGVWIVSFRQAYAAESIAHAMLPGLVVAALSDFPLLLGAAAGVLVAAAGIALAGRDERVGGDLGVAVVVTALFGLGTILALSPDTPARLQELLFGDLLGTTWGDLAVGAALVAAVVAALLVLHRRLALAAFDPATARSLGGGAGLAALAVLVLLAVTTVAAVQSLGNLLVVALLLAPGAAALNLTRRLSHALLLSALLAGLAGFLGLLASYHLGTAAGASVALAAVGIFLASLARAPVATGAGGRTAASSAVAGSLPAGRG